MSPVQVEMDGRIALRITVVFSGALGDTLLLHPMTEWLRSVFPGCRVTLVTTDSIGKLFVSLGWVEAAVDINLHNHHRWFGADTAATTPPWALCDWLISGVSNGHDHWAAAGQRRSTARRISYFDPRPHAQSNDHVVVQWCRQIGVPMTRSPSSVLATSPWKWQPVGRVVVLHPGSGGREKCWSLNHFKAVAQRLGNRNFQPRFILGPVECERMDKSELANLCREFQTITTDNLAELTVALSSAVAFCGNDSGVSHLAAMLGVPTVSIFIRSNPRWWCPVGRVVRVMASRQVLMPAAAVMMLPPEGNCLPGGSYGPDAASPD